MTGTRTNAQEQIMQLRTRVVSAVGIAAVVAAGGFAFTDSNVMPAYSSAGYNSVAATGALVKGGFGETTLDPCLNAANGATIEWAGSAGAYTATVKCTFATPVN